jgi:hypothetical protein
MFKLQSAWMLLAILGSVYGQSGGKEARRAPLSGTKQDEAAIRSLLAEGFETNWNSHQPAASVTPDKMYRRCGLYQYQWWLGQGSSEVR